MGQTRHSSLNVITCQTSSHGTHIWWNDFLMPFFNNFSLLFFPPTHRTLLPFTLLPWGFSKKVHWEDETGHACKAQAHKFWWTKMKHWHCRLSDHATPASHFFQAKGITEHESEWFSSWGLSKNNFCDLAHHHCQCHLVHRFNLRAMAQAVVLKKQLWAFSSAKKSHQISFQICHSIPV